MKIIYKLLFFLLFCFPLAALFHTGLPMTHDGQDHVARIANFYQNLQEGDIVPRWAPNLNWGYGHPILMFLYPLPSYLASLFHFVGFSFVDSVKVVFGISFVLSGLAMYLWLRAFLPIPAAVFGSLLYTYAPYRFVDLYVRGAIGEHVAFIFPPLVLYFLYRLFKKTSYWNLLGGAFSLAGLVLAHNAISLMFLPIILFYAGFLLLQSKKQKALFIHFTLLILFGFSLSAFFWMPAFLEGKYTLRDIVIAGQVFDRFVPWTSLFYGPWSYGITGQFTAQVGILHWLAVVTSIPFAVYLLRKKDKNWIIISFFLLVFLVTAYLMTAAAKPIWEIISLLQKFQFPWRLLSLSVFFSAVLGAFVLSFFSSKIQRVLLIILIVCILFLNKDYWYAKGYSVKPESFYSGIYDSTTDTGESAPIWSVRFMEKRPKAHIEVIEGKAVIKEGPRTGTKHEYVVTVSEKAKFVENTLYFPGWRVYVDDVQSPIEFQSAVQRGLMTFVVEKGKHTVLVEFGDTKLRVIANLVSLLSLFGIIGWVVLRKVVKSKVFKSKV